MVVNSRYSYNRFISGSDQPAKHTVASTMTKSAGVRSLRADFEYRVYQETEEQPDRQVHIRICLDQGAVG